MPEKSTPAPSSEKIVRGFDYFANAVEEIRRSSQTEFKELEHEQHHHSFIPQEFIDFMDAHCFPSSDYSLLELQ